MIEYTTEDIRNDQAENVKRYVTAEQQTRTRLADNYESFDRVLRQMYGGD